MRTLREGPRIDVGILALAATLAAPTTALHAAEIVADGTTCSLADAIAAANTDAMVGGCDAGSGADLIQLDADVTLTSAATAAVEGGPSGLPAISTDVTISARAGGLVERSAALDCVAEEPTAFRLFQVAAGGDLTLVGLTLRNGCIAPSDASVVASGGAILVEAGGALRLEDATLDANAALTTVPAVGNPGAARGGAVAVLGGTLEIAGGTLVGNEVVGHEASGGAIHVEDGEVVSIVGAVIDDNEAGPVPGFTDSGALLAAGGGLSFQRTQVGTLAGLVISNNDAGAKPGTSGGGAAAGGGLHLEEGRIDLLRDSLFVDNAASAGSFSPLAGNQGAGGGLASSGRIDAIVRTTFADNEAIGIGPGTGRGGGLENSGWIGLLEGVTFSENLAEGGLGLMLAHGPGLGGGVDTRGPIDRIVSTTFALNESLSGQGVFPEGRGGGLHVERNALEPKPAIENSLLADNLADVGADCFATSTLGSAGFNLVDDPDTSCDFSATGDVVGTDPALEPLADNGCSVALPDASCLPTIGFPEASAAVDQGNCPALSSVDARGALRPHDIVTVADAAGGDGCDVGAFERAATLADVHVATQVGESIDPVVSGSGAGNLVDTVTVASVGSMSAGNLAVDVDFTLPSGVSVDTVTPSVGSWDGAEWTISPLSAGDGATLTVVLTADASAASGTDVIVTTATVTATDSHDGPFTNDAEATSVLQPIFVDGFESGDAMAWSSCAPAGPPC